MTETWDIV